MKISNDQPFDAQEIEKVSRIVHKDGTVQANETIPGNDKVNISNRAKLLEEVKGDIDKLPDVRQDKIDTFRKLIDSGQYKADPEKIAMKLYEEMI